jgi:hypothetical protein
MKMEKNQILPFPQEKYLATKKIKKIKPIDNIFLKLYIM